MIGALMLQACAPGPQVMTERRPFLGLIASSGIGNLMLLVAQLPCRAMVKLLAVPSGSSSRDFFVFCCIGVYKVRQQGLTATRSPRCRRSDYVLIKLMRAGADGAGSSWAVMEENCAAHDDRSAIRRCSFHGGRISAAFLVAAAVLLPLVIAAPGCAAKREEAMQE